MCGIAGVVSLSLEQVPNLARRLRVMNELQKHRGPDGHAIWENERRSIGFAHRRLSIIDLSTGNQPMGDRTGNWITYNGEIYNHLELRTELGPEHFMTTSDTEAILHAYRRWGARCVDHLRGMFAFALWNEREQALFCARDRFGIKPFYYTIVDGIRGQGQYVGTYLAWGVHNTGWWGEGEIKFYLDGDSDFPTICGTGTEDYFCGSYNFENKASHQYQEFTTPYSGLSQVIRPDGLYNSQQRFGLYRWHIMDPVRFDADLRVTIQALGWRSDGRYLPLQDDIASTAFWYQAEPHAAFPKLPDRDTLEVK